MATEILPIIWTVESTYDDQSLRANISENCEM
jgi:hypothetical protein